VANAHAWGSNAVIFSDGKWAATATNIARDPSNRGTACCFSK
jgi:hypothetical protein